MSLVINGETIDDDLIENEFAAIKASYEQMAPISCCERNDEFRGYAKEKITAQVLLNQESANHPQEISSDDIDAAFAELVEEHGNEEAFYSAHGISADQNDQVRETLQGNLQVQKFIDSVCPDHEITEAMIQSYYNENIDEYLSAQRVRAMHVHKTPSRGEEREADFAAMCEARKRLLAGEDFHVIAEEYSTPVDESGEVEGEEKAEAKDETDRFDLGFFARGEMMDEFEILAFSMEIDEISPVFWTQFGFHVLKLIEREDAVPSPLDEIKDQVNEDLQHQLRNQDLEVYVQTLKAKATIEDDDCTEEGCCS